MSSLKNNNNQTTALVESVYVYNSPERKKTISNIWAKYNMLPDNLTQSLGKLYKIDEDLYNPGDIKGLYDYTHDKQSDYSRSITEKFLTVGEENTKSDIEDISKEEYKAWYNKAYQGKNYYDELSGYSHSFREKTNITYNDGNTYSGSDNGYSYIDYETENNFESTLITPSSQLTHHYFDKPKKSDYKNNIEAYKAAVDEWVKRKGNVHQEDKGTVDKFVDYLNEENSHIDEPKTILTKTAKLFKENKINSLVSRLYDNDTILEYADTSKSRQGRSRGRNLINRNASYDNPFCRSWAAHHQYGDKSSLIRGELINGKNINDSELVKTNRPGVREKYLEDYSVLKNGFVKITPENLGDNNYDTKRCMFSIENLAWKDINIKSELDADQIGPNNGRIMWFPPYDLHFQETSQVNWNENNFIGRGEPIYTYTNTRRSGSLSFTLLIDHPSIINEFNNRSEDEKDKYDEDNDILRFFAGCDIPMKLITNRTSTTSNLPKESTEETEISSSNAPKINLDIYFPPYFSGKAYPTDDNGVKNGLGWRMDYLFMGINANVSYDKNRWVGYEITKDIGLTQDVIPDSEKRFECNYTFGYFVDRSIECLEGLKTNELADRTSWELNSKTGDDNKITFADFYMLIYIWFKGDDEKNNDIFQYAKKIGVIKDSVNDFKTIKDNTDVFTNTAANTIHKKGGLEKYGIKIYYDKGDVSEKRKNGEIFNKTRAEFIYTILNDIIPGFVSIPQQKTGDDTQRYELNTKEAKCKRKVTLVFDEGAETWLNGVNIEGLVVEGKMEEKEENVYSPESEYFKNLEWIDNFAYQKIKEKIKYFDPAYHSISPEGFNARLTFLHQCTRQGHTIERKANDSLNEISTAGNMAFGRPPFCVLRIGDFINTKILIRNLNIVYQNGNGMQWDINPEGIGIQPMFAKVTMQIEIIGGQSLDAPITRLNNAISFNYYANTGVYDKRADIAIYDNKGGIKDEKIYIPTINNSTDTDSAN